MKPLPLVLLLVAVPCAALAQVREDDVRIATGRRDYEACINSKVATAQAMRGDPQWFQKLVEVECKNEADALYRFVVDWSRQQDPSAPHDAIAGLYVNKVMFNRVYGGNPTPFGGRAPSSSGSTGQADLFPKVEVPVRR